MRAMYLEKPGVIVEKNLPKPFIQGDKVLVRIKAVGVCGSDIEYYESGRIGDFIVEKPLILGHEASGEIVEIGENVVGLKIGDRVVLEPGIPCGKCTFCRDGRYNLCPDIQFMATPPVDGAFREYVAHPADFTFKIPNDLSFEEATLIEPLSVGIHVARRANIQLGDRVVILGAGPIGIMCLETSLIRGALEVTVTDVVDFRLAKAEDLGATEIINVKTASTELYAKTFDKVIQTAGTSETYGQGLALAARGGRIVQVGHPFAQHVPIDASLLISKELDMVGSYRYTNTYPEAISLINARKVHLKPLISKSFSLEEVKKALEYPKQHPDSCIKAVVRF